MMKFFKLLMGLAVYGFTATLVILAIGFWYVSNQFKTPLKDQAENVIFTIERGQGLRTIAQELYAMKLVDNPYVFEAGTMIAREHRNLKAGDYELSAALSPAAIMEKMVKGDVYFQSITIPEGLTSYQVVQRILADPNVVREIEVVPEEGTLLPETYRFGKDTDPLTLINRMREDMNAFLEEVLPQRSDNLPFESRNEILTLASIVEKETAVPSERKRIAGVFVNRLRRGIPLQTDPTVIYALTKGRHKDDGQGPLGRRLLSKDLEYDSPYNTYKYAGLPPGPIANPGKASIEAVLHPEEHDFIYFVADGTGGHVFSKTLAEHNANVAKWRKIRRSQQ